MKRIFNYKGFIKFDTGGDEKEYYKLSTSTFLSRDPYNCMYYCMYNNTAINWIRNHIVMFKDYKLDISLNPVKYIPEWNRSFIFPTFEGIIWKPHQELALKLIKRYKRYCIFLGQGTGKTLIALGAIKMVHPLNPVLILTPKRAIAQYTREAQKYLPDYKVSSNPDEDADIYIINFESVDKFTKKYYSMMIVDESHRAKNPTSLINKTLCTIKTDAIYLFTGTPQDKHEGEVFAQLKILNPELMGLKGLFYNRFFELDDYFRVIKTKHEDELKEIIEACTYGDKTDNLIELPSENEHIVKCDIGPLKDMYNQFLDDKVYDHGDWYILGDSGAKHRTKLTQICSGFVIDENKNVHRLPFNPKFEAFMNVVSNISSAIIYTVFDEEQAIVCEMLDQAHRTYVTVNGKSKDSADSLKKFGDGEVEFLVIQIVSGNASLDFPQINNIIYYSLHDSYIYFDQSKYRIRRIGQTKECNYYFLIVKGSVETKRLSSLRRKKSFNNREFELYRRLESESRNNS